MRAERRPDERQRRIAPVLGRLGLCCLIALGPIGPWGRSHALAAELGRTACDRAQATDPTLVADSITVDPALVRDMVMWIGTETDYDTSSVLNDPPDVSLCAVGERIAFEGEEVIVDRIVRAAYDAEADLIYLVAPWDPADLMDQAALLHELVHAVQLANRGWPCLQAPEWEAYRLTETWLKARGVDPGFDWLVIYFMSLCPRDHHPD